MTVELDDQPRPSESAGGGLAQPCHTDPDTRGSTPGQDDPDTRVSTPGVDDRDTRVSTPGVDDPDTRVSTPGVDDRDTRVSTPGVDDLIGQEMVVRNLRRAVRAPIGRNEPLGHVLLCGPPGLGKTSFARAVAAELGRECRTVLAPFVSEPHELARQIAEVPAGGVLFIDEVHRLPLRAAESLYVAMEASRMTIIGATTDSAMLPPAFRSRFALRQDLEHYTLPEITAIQHRAAVRLAVAIDDDAAVVLATASRDTPRRPARCYRASVSTSRGCTGSSARSSGRSAKRAARWGSSRSRTAWP